VTAFIDPPPNPPVLLRLGFWLTKKITGRDLLPARILAWVPKTALAAGLLESLAIHSFRQLNPRMLKLIRLSASYSAACPFCIDMNSYQSISTGISDEEMQALRQQKPVGEMTSLNKSEQVAVTYSRMISASPLIFHPDFIDELKIYFSEAEIVAIASTSAQVNYWARLIQALGIPPAGFMD
jgi:alkylhydroperoxidase family enzyme